jgi:hypothetical protein
VYRSSGQFTGRWIFLASGCWLVGASTAWAQPAPSQEPSGGPPPTARSTVPPTAAALPAATTREAQLEARIQQLEAIVDQIQYQVGQTGRQSPGGPVEGGSGLAPSKPGTTPTPGAVVAGRLPGAQSVSPSGGLGVPGQSFPSVPPPANRFNLPATRLKTNEAGCG